MSDKNTYKKIQFGSKTQDYVQYGFSYIEGNSEPHFSITGHYQNAGGCIHDEIAQHFPNLKPLIQFHLWGQNTGLPLYYIENGLYHYKNDMDIFKEHILLQPGEVIPDTDIKEWLISRIPMLNKLFEKTINEFNIEKIKL